MDGKSHIFFRQLHSNAPYNPTSFSFHSFGRELWTGIESRDVIGDIRASTTRIRKQLRKKTPGLPKPVVIFVETTEIKTRISQTKKKNIVYWLWRALRNPFQVM